MNHCSTTVHFGVEGFRQVFLNLMNTEVIPSTLWRLAAFGDFQEKTPKRMWLCMGISPVW